MKVVTIEIPDDSEIIREGDIYRIRQVEVPRTWEVKSQTKCVKMILGTGR